MADISDVENALCDVILDAIYPNGITTDSISGDTVKIYRGWPNTVALNHDIAAQNQTVTVISEERGTKNTTRHAPVWRTVSYQPPTIVLNIEGNVCTISGLPTAAQLIGIELDGVGYTYVVKDDDTCQSIADALASLIPGAVGGQAMVSFPFARTVVARMSGSATSVMETRRQEQRILVALWCSSPQARDLLAEAIDTLLSTVDWLVLGDGTRARLIYQATAERDEAVNANVYRRDLVYSAEYPTVITSKSFEMMFGIGNLIDTSRSRQFADALPVSSVILPKLGAIRFDAWYDPSNTIDAQCANALGAAAYDDRLPPNAVVSESGVFWPLATQATMDAEIDAACLAGLNFWAFDSFAPNDTLGLALQLYLSSSSRSRLGFCMLGQSSNWGAGGQDQPVLLRDIALMSQPGYVNVLGGRPLYFVLDASAEQTAGLPAGGVRAAIAFVRQAAEASGVGNPYIVWLSGAPLAAYDNVAVANAVGADAAGSYANPQLNGAMQSYSALAQSAVADWSSRARAGMSMIPTAMCGWDQRPLIERPQPFYPLSSDLTDQDYYQTGTSLEIGTHIADMAEFVLSNTDACPAQIGLVYAWNEFAEGGWLCPTWTISGPDTQRVETTGAGLRARAATLARAYIQNV